MRVLSHNKGLAFEAFAVSQPTRFFWLFEQLALNPASKLTPSPATFEALVALGRAMTEAGTEGDSSVPAWMTYFGQFIDHDITSFAALDHLIPILSETDNPAVLPISPADATIGIANERTPHFDLDSVYEGLAKGPSATSGDKFIIGSNTQVVTPGNAPPRAPVPGKSKGADGHFDHDLPRVNKVAQIGDKRNDENLIIAQMHLAFLKLHNVLVAGGMSRETARRTIQQHYQWIVLNEYLPAICDPAIAASAAAGNGLAATFTSASMPLEFAFAAFRFGHSMVRDIYSYNNNFPGATLSELFTFTQLSGSLPFGDTLVDNWIIQWHRFVDFDPARPTNQNPSRHFDTRLADELRRLMRPGGIAEPNNAANLAVRNLIRGYLVGLPTGQAIAAQLVADGLIPAGDVLTGAQLIANAAGSEATALTAGGFDRATPLWYYVLAEAKIKTQGQRLGPVGSWIVAGTIAGLIRATPNSVLRVPNFAPSLGPVAGQFRFADLLRKAGVGDMPTGALA